MNVIIFLLPPIMGGLIALFTNWLAIRMLFRPHLEKRIFGIKIPFTPGLIPKEWDNLTEKLAEAISTRLLTPEVLAKELADPWLWLLPDKTVGELVGNDWAEPIGTQLKKLADSLLPKAIDAAINFPQTHPGLDQQLAALTYKLIDDNTNPMTALFVSKKKLYTRIKTSALDHLADPQNHDALREKLHIAIDTLLEHGVLNENIHNFHIRDGITAILQKEKHAFDRVFKILAKYLSENLPVKTMIKSKLASFDVAEAEEIILSVAGRELRMIVLLGGVLGFAIGLLISVV